MKKDAIHIFLTCLLGCSSFYGAIYDQAWAYYIVLALSCYMLVPNFSMGTFLFFGIDAIKALKIPVPPPIKSKNPLTKYLSLAVLLMSVGLQTYAGWYFCALVFITNVMFSMHIRGRLKRLHEFQLMEAELDVLRDAVKDIVDAMAEVEKEEDKAKEEPNADQADQ